MGGYKCSAAAHKMAVTLLLAAALAQRQTCADCTEELFCLVTRETNAECMDQEGSDNLGGCGTAGFYQVDGEEVAFSSERCIFGSDEAESTTTTVPEPHVPSESPSGGAIAGIVVGAVATVALAVYLTLKFGRRTTARSGGSMVEERQRFL